MLQLLQQRRAQVPLFTGWISGTSIIQVWYNLGRPPASFMAYFMVLAALVNFAGDALASGLVKTDQVPSRCQSGAGVVIPQKATDYIPELE
jgi:hydrogenase/urease accessory protein HupE